MVDLILPRKGMDDNVGFLSKEAEDSGEWLDWGQWSDVVEPVLWCMLNEMRVTFDPTIYTEEAMKLTQPGLRTVKIDSQFTCMVNWSRQWEGSLPPYHVGVVFKDQDIACLSTLLEMRTCWACGVTGWHTPSMDHVLRTGQPAKKIPRCVPTEFFLKNGAPVLPCPGYAKSTVNGKVISWQDCGHLDWYAHMKGVNVSLYDLQEAAASKAADNDQRDDEVFAELSPN